MRARLLGGALELLRKHPGRLPTTFELSQHVHVSIGTVYRYFVDIESIVEELRNAAVHDITTQLATGVARAMDQNPAAAMVTVVDTLTSAFEQHEAIVRSSLAEGQSEQGAAWSRMEGQLVPLARILPARFRPDLDDAEISDLTFLTMGATASLCMRVALFRPPNANRESMIATVARMLLAAFDGPP